MSPTLSDGVRGGTAFASRKPPPDGNPQARRPGPENALAAVRGVSRPVRAASDELWGAVRATSWLAVPKEPILADDLRKLHKACAAPEQHSPAAAKVESAHSQARRFGWGGLHAPGRSIPPKPWGLFAVVHCWPCRLASVSERPTPARWLDPGCPRIAQDLKHPALVRSAGQPTIGPASCADCVPPRR